MNQVRLPLCLLKSQSTRLQIKLILKIRQNGKDNGSGGGSSTKSFETCHECGKDDHIKRDYKSNVTGSDGDLSVRYTANLPKQYHQESCYL